MENFLFRFWKGGKQFQKRTRLQVLEKGEKIIDSYTNEVIGNIETVRKD